MLTGVHFLLTYSCTLKCDHCFLYSSPTAKGTMTLGQIRAVLEEARIVGTVKEAYFEGGEPFLFYPVMVEGIRLARRMGLRAGIVSNGYWATCVEDAQLWLGPLAELGISGLSVSDDELHYGDRSDSPAKCALAAAGALGMPTSAISKTKPEVLESPDVGAGRGAPEISGGTKLRGRAAEKFAQGLPTRTRSELKECPYEELVDPQRVHIDAYGNVQVCQGISIGNCWERALSELVKQYDAPKHPICGPLVRGGPARLAEEHGLELKGAFVDECHLCYAARSALLDRFPECLAPRQVYGLE